MADHSMMKLGKQPPKKMYGLRALVHYTKALDINAPDACDWSIKVQNYGMMLNDKFGDCTCAAAGHFVQIWTVNASSEFSPPDDAIVGMYEGACGYNPSDPSTDQGGIEIDVLKWWKDNGLAGHTIDAFVAVSPIDHTDVKNGIWLCGGLYTGFALPISCQQQEIWDVVDKSLTGDSAPGSWGGHAVIAVGYDSEYVTIITWGAPKKMTWAFWYSYCDEDYGVLSKDWMEIGGEGPNKLPFDQLVNDFPQLAV